MVKLNCYSNSGAYIYVYLLIALQRFTSGLIALVVVQPADHILEWMTNVLISNAEAPSMDLNSYANYTSDNFTDNLYNQAVSYFSAANGFYSFSAAIGSFVAGHYVLVSGRKFVLITNAIFSIINLLLFSTCVYFNSIPIFVTSRILSGVQYGAASVVVYLYIVEISPLKYKSLSTSLLSIAVYLGVCTSAFLGLDYIIDGSKFWQYSTAVQSVFPILQVIFVKFIPESPTYLFNLKKYEAGKKVVHYLFKDRFDCADLDLTEECNEKRIKRLSAMRDSVPIRHSSTSKITDSENSEKDRAKFEKNLEKSVLYRIYHDPNLLKPIIYSCILSLTNNLSGLEALGTVLTLVIKNTFDFDHKMAQVMTFIICVVRGLSATIGASLSHKIDRKVCLLRFE